MGGCTASRRTWRAGAARAANRPQGGGCDGTVGHLVIVPQADARGGQGLQGVHVGHMVVVVVVTALWDKDEGCPAGGYTWGPGAAKGARIPQSGGGDGMKGQWWWVSF